MRYKKPWGQCAECSGSRNLRTISLCDRASASVPEESLREASSQANCFTSAQTIPPAVSVALKFIASMSATSCLLSPRSYHVRHCICTGFNASLIRARPALKLQTASNSYQRRSLSECHRPFVTCQQGRQVRSRPASVHNPEICMDEDVPKPVPAWQRFAGFLFKSTAVIALALALVRPLKQILLQYFLIKTCARIFSGWSCCRLLVEFRLLKQHVVEDVWVVHLLARQDQAAVRSAGIQACHKCYLLVRIANA